MTEFKFACPNCGQHITAAASASGTQLECPTCFRKLVVPQAPATADSKLILSASSAEKTRPAPSVPGAEPWLGRRARGQGPVLVVLMLLVAGGAAAGLYFYQHHQAEVRSLQEAQAKASNALHMRKAAVPPPVTYPLPTNIDWSLTLTNVEIPEGRAVGSIHGSGFYCERATLRGGELNLRQGASWPPDLGVTISLFANQGEELSGKTIEITAEREKSPAVRLRWKDAQGKQVTSKIAGGYALRLVFGQAANGRMPGKLYLALPDDEKSFVGGTFDAEIQKRSPPKPKAPPKPGK